jgi:hypothetical protein
VEKSSEADEVQQRADQADAERARNRQLLRSAAKVKFAGDPLSRRVRGQSDHQKRE